MSNCPLQLHIVERIHVLSHELVQHTSKCAVGHRTVITLKMHACRAFLCVANFILIEDWDYILLKHVIRLQAVYMRLICCYCCIIKLIMQIVARIAWNTWLLQLNTFLKHSRDWRIWLHSNHWLLINNWRCYDWSTNAFTAMVHCKLHIIICYDGRPHQYVNSYEL